MLYFVVDKDGSEWVFDEPPKKDYFNECWIPSNNDTNVICLPKGSILKLTQTETSWEGGIVTKNNNYGF